MMRAVLPRVVATLSLAWMLWAPMARADDPPAPVLDEVVVTSERSGPGLWHVHSAAGDLWILGSLSPLPKGITWRSKQVEQVLDSTNRVLLQKPFEIGVARVLWLLITERSLLLVTGGKRLRDVMPPALHDRFAAQRAKYTNDADKWEHYRPIIAAAFLQQAAFHAAGLSTRLDLGAAVRSLADKHHVRIEELKIAGVRDAIDELKTMSPAAENICVEASLVTIERDLPRLVDRADAWAAGNIERLTSLHEPPEVDACRAALTEGAGAGDIIAVVKKTWLDNLLKYLQSGGVTLAVVNTDLLLEHGGVLDQLRAKGYEIQGP